MVTVDTLVARLKKEIAEREALLKQLEQYTTVPQAMVREWNESKPKRQYTKRHPKFQKAGLKKTKESKTWIRKGKGAYQGQHWTQTLEGRERMAEILRKRAADKQLLNAVG